MRYVVTGAGGFLGWHLRVLAAARGEKDVVALDRSTCGDPDLLASAIDGASRVVHLGGVNRGSDDEVYNGNVMPAQVLATAIARCARPPTVAFANSTQSGTGTVYGNAKARASTTLRDAADRVGTGFADLILPNLFGEHGRPFYNSVVATFSHQLARGEQPHVEEDRLLHILHARSAASALLDTAPSCAQTVLEAAPITVSDIATQLIAFATAYSRAEIPALEDELSVDLFNTYRSYCSPVVSAAPLLARRDDRGALVEAVKVHGGTGQCFFSTSRPGVVRGQHYHLRKVERFVVVEGDAVISLRRKFDSSVVDVRVSGDEPVAVDMPTMWVHNLRNIGSRPLLTLFWTNDLFDADAPDTYPEEV